MEHDFLKNEEAYLFAQGTWQRAYDRLGAHPAKEAGEEGYRFALWAPGAQRVSVAGSFNNWNANEFILTPDAQGGVWHGFIPGAKSGDAYKYVIETAQGDILYKADPYAFYAEKPPETASRLYDISAFPWSDGRYLEKRKKRPLLEQPLNIYEVNLGSWRRGEEGEYCTYGELGEKLVAYALEMGYTHLEIMPVMEHPFDGSWGYQITGYYAPTSRFGTPHEFAAFVDTCHQAGLGVILDWVPGHFCRDAHGLAALVGDKLYEKEDHAQWGTYKFDLERGEVRSFLLSNLLFWIEQYHVDGIRVDGVTSMLYLNFGIDDPQSKRFNERGTEEDLDAVDFIRKTNEAVGINHPDVLMIAEESTAWPLVTYPPETGGLGFHLKWDMGWMHDTLHYMQTDFPYRPSNHKLLTFSMMYAFNENFVLALSHDEVVHGKCSLIGRMPGDYWRQFAGLRLLALYQICHPGAKLNFMGNEIAQFIEWRYYEGIEWFLLAHEAHQKHRAFIRDLNALYLREGALWQKSYSWEGFQWLDADNEKQSILLFLRRGKRKGNDLVVVLSFVPETHDTFRVGVPRKGVYREIFSSNEVAFGGSGGVNRGEFEAEKIPMHGMDYSIQIATPPIGGAIFKRIPQQKKKKDPAK